jgi:predicted anti-sigma-YlaC factor YlaD
MNTENSDAQRVCASLAADLVLAADDELSTAEWRAVEQHLALCPACRAQWAAFPRTDRRLLECAAELNALRPSDSAMRARLVSALSRRERNRWARWLPGQGNRGWAVASLASLSLAALVAWTILTPGNLERRRTERPDVGSLEFAAADKALVSAEVVRVKLSLAAVGDPFLDGSQAESLVLADVAVGSDGQPTGIRLAE